MALRKESLSCYRTGRRGSSCVYFTAVISRFQVTPVIYISWGAGRFFRAPVQGPTPHLTPLSAPQQDDMSIILRHWVFAKTRKFAYCKCLPLQQLLYSPGYNYTVSVLDKFNDSLMYTHTNTDVVTYAGDCPAVLQYSTVLGHPLSWRETSQREKIDQFPR